MALDATVKGSAANSYLTEVEATTYLTTERLYVTAWTAASVPNREAALIWATFLLDNSFDFDGEKTTLGQALRWPRMGVEDQDGVDLPYHDIPGLIKKATATLALNLITSNRLAEPGLLGQGIEEAKVGPIQVKVNMLSVKDPIPDEVTLMLSSIARLKASATEGSAAVPLLRG